MANQALNSGRRHFMAGSGGIALYAGLPAGASAKLLREGDKERAEDHLLFVSERWEALPVSVGRTPGCVLGTILPGQERAEYEFLPLEAARKVIALAGPLLLVVGTGARSLIYNAATRKTSTTYAPDGFLFTGAAASLPGGAAAVGLRHDSSSDVEGAGVGLIDGSGADSVSLHELAGGPVVELAWSSPTDQLLVMQKPSRKPGPYQVSGVQLSPLTVRWSQKIECGQDPGRCAIAPHPDGGAIVALSGSSPVPTAGNEALAPDLDGPMDRAALMRGRVERPAQLVWVSHGQAARDLEIPSAAPMRGLGTITYTESADVIACTFWDSDVVVLLRGGKYASHIFAHDLGLTRVAGAAILGDTQALAVCGLDRYTAVVDLATEKLKRRFRTENFRAYELAMKAAREIE